MKRFSVFVLLLLIGVFLLPTAVFAQLGNGSAVGGGSSSACPPGYESLCRAGPDTNPNLFGNIVQFLIVIAIVVSVVFMIWGGIIWITSGGDKGKVEQARSAITGAIIGLLIALLAYAIVSYVFYLITGKSGLDFKIPRLID